MDFPGNYLNFQQLKFDVMDFPGNFQKLKFDGIFQEFDENFQC